MTWALVALLGYFFAAISSVFDKYLLSDRIPAPAVYAFFVSLFSLFALGFIPFGAHFLDVATTGILLISGVMFVYGLVALYEAIKQHEISRVAPLTGTIISLVAFSAVFFPGVSGEMVGTGYILALVLLIIGGLLISFDLPLRRGEHISRYVFLSGFLMGTSLLFLKEGYEMASVFLTLTSGYEQSGFVSGIVWSRLGMVMAGLSLLLVPRFRAEVVAQFRGFHHPSSRATSTTAFFVLNKMIAGVSMFLVSYAISIGSVSFVQALSGMQYVFLLLMTLPLSFRYPAIFGERLHFWDWFQKVVAVCIIGLGLWFATMSGIALLPT